MTNTNNPIGPKKKLTLGQQGLMYIFVGLTSALIEIATFQALHSLVGINVEFANIIAVVLSTAYNFTLNGRITFQSQSNKLVCLIKYLALFAFNLCFTTLCISWLVSIGVDPLIAKLFTMGCVVAWNFVLYRKFVFV